MSEVADFHDAENHGQPDRYQAIDAAYNQPVQNLLQE
jgi:hypothetical protein